MNEMIVSNSTKRNWKRLGVDFLEVESRLSKRANKKFSSKCFVPVEYFQNKQNVLCLEKVLNMAQGLPVENVIYSLALLLCKINNLVYFNSDNSYSVTNQYLKEILQSFDSEYKPIFDKLELPHDEQDFLGIVYQSLQKEGRKSINGSYYTPEGIIKEAFNNLENGNKTFLDPCCGTGSFLLAAADIIGKPENIYGADKDKIACFIAKINLILKFKEKEFNPNIYNIDFLLDNTVFNKKFDIIATNPPWGAECAIETKNKYPEIISGESFSYFIVKIAKKISKNGKAVFILPQSILNVAIHKDVRAFILENFYIDSISLLGRAFSRVLSGVVILKLSGFCSDNNVKIYTKNSLYIVNKEFYREDSNYNFSVLDNKDALILNKIFKTNYEVLKDSIFAIGVVTGNNKKYVVEKYRSGYEKIYTGKEVDAYFLKPVRKYIKFDRTKFQQTAADEIYRADEKLVYKFISSKPVFAYDNTGSLFLNSANILIPKLKSHNVKTALAYLNSTLFKYIYQKKFNEIKILKWTLSEMPFPILSNEEFKKLNRLVEKYFKTHSDDILSDIDDFVFSSFGLGKDDIIYIKENVWGIK